jgi:hypothetical protein
VAVLSSQERVAIRAQWCSDLSAARTPFNLSRPDLQAAIDAIDSWVDTNAAAFNTALPLPARTVLTAQQKAWLLSVIVRRRYEVS